MSGTSWVKGNSRMYMETRQRMEEIVRLHRQGLTQTEISKRVHVSQGVVSQHLTRARLVGMLADSSRYTRTTVLTIRRLEAHLARWPGRFTKKEREAIATTIEALKRIGV